MTDGFPLHPGFDEILKFCRDFLAFSSLTLPNVHTLNSTGCKCTRVNEWGGERRGKGGKEWKGRVQKKKRGRRRRGKVKRRERMEECQVIKETEEERGNKREERRWRRSDPEIW